MHARRKEKTRAVASAVTLSSSEEDVEPALGDLTSRCGDRTHAVRPDAYTWDERSRHVAVRFSEMKVPIRGWQLAAPGAPPPSSPPAAASPPHRQPAIQLRLIPSHHMQHTSNCMRATSQGRKQTAALPVWLVLLVLTLLALVLLSTCCGIQERKERGGRGGGGRGGGGGGGGGMCMNDEREVQRQKNERSSIRAYIAAASVATGAVIRALARIETSQTLLLLLLLLHWQQPPRRHEHKVVTRARR